MLFYYSSNLIDQQFRPTIRNNYQGWFLNKIQTTKNLKLLYNSNTAFVHTFVFA